MSTKFKQPGILSRLTCLLFGHKFLYDGMIKARPTPTLINYIYKENSESATSVGLSFCPRCYTFHGIHFTEKKEPVIQEPETVTEKTKGKKPKATIKKFKK